MLKEYIRDTAFFQTVRDRNIPITAKELDLEFNNLITHINKKIKPLVEILDNKQIPGIADNVGTFLQNVGDGTTRFTRVDSSAILNYSLTLQKLANINPFSVIASDNGSIFRAVTPTANNQMLVGRVEANPTWQLAVAEYFEDNTIPANKIALNTLTANHLADGILGRPLDINSVETQHIQNGSFNANYLQDKIYDSTCISNALMGTRAVNLFFKNESISHRHIADNSFDYSYIGNRTVYKFLYQKTIPNNSIVFPATNSLGLTGYSTWPFSPQAFMAYHIKPESFEIRDKGYANIGKEKLSPLLRERLRQGGLQI
jgi:hypothetical protein